MLTNVKAKTLSTQMVEPPHRLSFWREVICDVFVKLDCERVREEGEFSGTIVNGSIGDLQFSEVISTGQHVIRSKAQLARASGDYFLISVQTAGHGRVVQDGRTADLSVGQFALYDTSRPYELMFEDNFSQLVIRIPRQAFSNRVMVSDRLTARAMNGRQGVGRIALSYLAELDRSFPSVDPSMCGRLCDTFIDLLSLAVSSDHMDQPDVSNVRLTQLYRIQRYIEDHLSEPDLSPQRVAAHHRISTRYLNMLFEAADSTAARWIWQRRLEKCERDLLDPRYAGRTIGEIAYSWGFNDLTHFSRTFKARYGLSPRDYRESKRSLVSPH
ncbi:MAG: helix-turn-helix domain-containing protein [Alphaproteobacteria bacterium]|nr:MAG: helix-turn-helix domain-containing protein [Alphaproteobacteria bacterium]